MARTSSSPLQAAAAALLCAVLLASSASSSHAQPAASTLVLKIKSLDDSVLSEQKRANGIVIGSGALYVLGMGPFPGIIKGLNDLEASCRANANALRGAKPYPKQSDQKLVYVALERFFQDLQQVVLTIHEGFGRLTTPDAQLAGRPVRDALNNLQSQGLDQLANAIIHLIPAYEGLATQAKDRLYQEIFTIGSIFEGLFGSLDDLLDP